MNMITSFARRRPVIFSLVLFVVTILFAEIPLGNLLLRFLEERTASYLSGILEQGIVSILLLLLIKRLGLMRYLGSVSPIHWKNLWMVIPGFVLAIICASDFLGSGQVLDSSIPFIILLYILVFLSTGFFEEYLARGVMMFLLLEHWGDNRKGIYQAVVVSSLIFSLAHIVNLLMGRYSGLAVISQICLALCIAVYFAACVLRMGSIYPVVLLHAIVNMSGNLNEIAVGGGIVHEVYRVSPGDLLGIVLVALPFLLLGLFFLRKVKVFPPE